MKMLWFIYPFCSIFIIVGAVLSYKQYQKIRKARIAESWPTVEAQLLKCNLKDTSDSDGESYEVLVEYTYQVFGIEYTSDRIHPSYSSSSASGHKPLYTKLKLADQVLVYYNPDDPAESYLIVGNFGFHKAALCGGLLFFLAGVMFLLTFHYAITGSSNYADRVTVIEQADR